MEKLIEGILENFNFEKVRKTMEFLDWKYFDSEETPTTYRLIKSAEKRLEEAYKKATEDKQNYYVASGGFKAFAEYNEETGIVDFLELSFVLTSWDEQIDE
jgi:hypothetical protein